MRDEAKYLLWQASQAIYEEDKTVADAAVKKVANALGVTLSDGGWADKLETAIAECHSAKTTDEQTLQAIALSLGYAVEVKESTPKGEQLPVTAEYSTVTI